MNLINLLGAGIALVLSVSQAFADTTLLSLRNLSGVKSSAIPHNFNIPYAVDTATLTLYGSAGSPRAQVRFSLILPDNPNQQVTYQATGAGTWTIKGLVPGTGNLLIEGVTAYRGLNVQLNGVRANTTAVTDIPGIMQNNGWSQGATLLNHWFDSKGTASSSTIKMNWALGFPRIKAIYDQILAEKIYANDAAKGLLSQNLRSSAGMSFQIYCNSRAYTGRPLTSCVLGFDDFDVSLNACTLRVVAGGRLDLVSGRRFVTITSVGVYIADNFNFNGSQSLAWWNYKTNYAGCNPLLGTEITNSAFQKYQLTTGKGRGFEVSSDTKWTTLAIPVKFEIY